MIAPIRSADARESVFGRLHTLIAGRPASPDAARAEARQLISMTLLVNIEDDCNSQQLVVTADDARRRQHDRPYILLPRVRAATSVDDLNFASQDGSRDRQGDTFG